MARMVTYNARSAKPHPETAHLSGIDVLALMRDQELEQIVALNDPATGLSGFVVIHDTTRGPAIGGCRLWSYPTAEAALEDAIRLAVAMTRKCALAGLNAGGGKGVLIDHAGIKDRAGMLRAMGRYVESFGGRFYTSGDLGLSGADIARMRETSRYVAVPDDRKLDLAVTLRLSGGAFERTLVHVYAMSAEGNFERVFAHEIGRRDSANRVLNERVPVDRAVDEMIARIKQVAAN
jgi:hypothetical protein